MVGVGKMRRNYSKLEWYVWVEDVNTKTITTRNMLSENSWTIVFIKDCLKRKKPILASEIQRDLMYHYWSKAEFEIMVYSLFRYSTSRKIDWYMQIALNFEPFLQYLEKNLNIEIIRDKELEDSSWMWR